MTPWPNMRIGCTANHGVRRRLFAAARCPAVFFFGGWPALPSFLKDDGCRFPGGLFPGFPMFKRQD